MYIYIDDALVLMYNKMVGNKMAETHTQIYTSISGRFRLK